MDIFRAIEKNNIKKVKKLLDDGMDINMKDSSGSNALIIAVAYTTSPRMVQLLIDKGIDINVRNNYGMTALMLAVSYRKTKLVKLLLATGANINKKNRDGNTALMMAKEEEYEFKSISKKYKKIAQLIDKHKQKKAR